MYACRWSDFVYACSWSRGELGCNLFFKRWDGTYTFECWCKKGLDTYDPWGSRWSRRYSYSDAVVECYTRLGDSIDVISPEFATATCGGHDSGIRFMDTSLPPTCWLF